jgi:hypothetical protein
MERVCSVAKPLPVKRIVMARKQKQLVVVHVELLPQITPETDGQLMEDAISKAITMWMR